MRVSKDKREKRRGMYERERKELFERAVESDVPEGKGER